MSKKLSDIELAVNSSCPFCHEVDDLVIFLHVTKQINFSTQFFTGGLLVKY